MLIKSNRKYEIICKDNSDLIHQWNLTIIPSKRAWKLNNQEIKPGDELNGYSILSVKKKVCQYNDHSSILKEDFIHSVNTSGIRFAVDPTYQAAYCCQLCGGIVANDICTECMFDWDS
jgi:hypothetical protein